jgi:hypothetical protein
MTYMSVEQSREQKLVRVTEVLEENLLQCHLGHCCGKLVTNCLNYGTAFRRKLTEHSSP